MTKERLLGLCDTIILNRKFEPGVYTYCNLAVQYVSFEFGCTDFTHGQLANSMCDWLQQSHAWDKCGAEDATKFANQGRLVIASQRGEPHGHVAVVAPRPMQRSNSLDMDVPMVANVGKENRYMRVSQAFPVARGLPDFHVWAREA